jgi:hypothetical protein
MRCTLVPASTSPRPILTRCEQVLAAPGHGTVTIPVLGPPVIETA